MVKAADLNYVLVICYHLVRKFESCRLRNLLLLPEFWFHFSALPHNASFACSKQCPNERKAAINLVLDQDATTPRITGSDVMSQVSTYLHFLFAFVVGGTSITHERSAYILTSPLVLISDMCQL